MPYDIAIQRVYQPSASGRAVLVDRLWPRGIRRADLVNVTWYRHAAPSSALRRDWHNEEIDRASFATRYQQELNEKPESLLPLMQWARQGPLVLLTATRNPELSHLPLLRARLLEELAEEDFQADGRETSSPTCYRDEFDF